VAETKMTQDVMEVIAAQHAEIRRLFEAAIDDLSTSFDALVRLLAVHETAEEMVVYPTLRNMGGDAREVIDARKKEEDAAKKALAEMEGLEHSSELFGQMLHAFRVDVEEHAMNEETQVFPLLSQIDSQTRARMAQAFLLAEKMAPTHAHRMAPESGVGNLLVGPFVAMVDRVRDAIRRTGAKPASD
jgi:hemerythrin superfamily protein